MENGICARVYQLENGEYHGKMIDGKKQGYGVYKFTDGRIYKGNYVDDLRSG